MRQSLEALDGVRWQTNVPGSTITNTKPQCDEIPVRHVTPKFGQKWEVGQRMLLIKYFLNSLDIFKIHFSALLVSLGIFSRFLEIYLVLK
jgi:hypothetical protein